MVSLPRKGVKGGWASGLSIFSSAEHADAVHVEVAFTPALLTEAERKVCIIIDVLRATSSAVTMLGRGLAEALVAESAGSESDD